MVAADQARFVGGVVEAGSRGRAALDSAGEVEGGVVEELDAARNGGVCFLGLGARSVPLPFASRTQAAPGSEGFLG